MNINRETHHKYNILVLDDEPLIRQSLYEVLRIDGYRAHMAASAEEALELIPQQKIDIVVTDMKLPKLSGIDFLDKIKSAYPDIEVIVITGFGTIESAVEAMRKGAYDYVTKPINDNEIKIIINKIVEKREILEENRNLREIIANSQRSSFSNIIGASEKMLRVYNVIESVANSNATILITGESGTGKGMVAKAIHETDQARCGKPFVEISCGALSENLLESELFGHVKGAFTGAIKDKEGRFEYAHGGTVFLDEIDAFTPNLQVKLLRVLQDGVFERVGDNVTRKTNARIIVATNQSLPELVQKGTFRADLYYRVNVISVQMPPLRDRLEDLDLLVKNFVTRYAQANRKKVSDVDEGVMQVFRGYSWPGNIRELENAIEGALIMTKGDIIRKEDLHNLSKFVESEPVPARSAAVSGDGRPLKKVLEQPEKELILSILKEHGWNRNQAAEALGINRTTLYNKMKKYNIPFEKSKGR